MIEQVESEMGQIEDRIDMYVSSADCALNEVREIGVRGKVLSKQLKNMRLRLRRNTKRLCDLLDGLSHERS